MKQAQRIHIQFYDETCWEVPVQQGKPVRVDDRRNTTGLRSAKRPVAEVIRFRPAA